MLSGWNLYYATILHKEHDSDGTVNRIKDSNSNNSEWLIWGYKASGYCIPFYVLYCVYSDVGINAWNYALFEYVFEILKICLLAPLSKIVTFPNQN